MENSNSMQSEKIATEISPERYFNLRLTPKSARDSSFSFNISISRTYLNDFLEVANKAFVIDIK